MQKNVPKYTPEWVATVALWAEASQRQVTYALCNDRRTLLWFANQRAVEYHPTLFRLGRRGRTRPTHLVLDLDPPAEDGFALAVRAAHLVRQALTDAGLEGAVKTSGAKGVHVFVPVDDGASTEDAAAGQPGGGGPGRAARPGPGHDRLHPGGPGRQGVPRLDPGRRGDGGGGLQPPGPARACRCRSRAVGRPRRRRPRRLHRPHRPGPLGDGDPWAARCPTPQPCRADWSRRAGPSPAARVQAMHEGKAAGPGPPVVPPSRTARGRVTSRSSRRRPCGSRRWPTGAGRPGRSRASC